MTEDDHPYVLVSTDSDLARVLPGLAASDGPVAVDTERACGFRYSQRAYLIQLRTMETGIVLVDPVKISEESLGDLDDALKSKEWILHAANQDLPSLREAGLNPEVLFDTEVCARLLNHEKVGLGPLVEEVLGVSLAKEHANSDWSSRPLPPDWLSYAAGDVAYLIELADGLRHELAAQGKEVWATQEFAHILAQAPPEPKTDPWRSTTDIHTVRTRRGMAVVREIWTVRDRIAREMDLAPHRIVNDRAITALALRATETGVKQVLEGFNRGDWRHRICKEHIDEFRAGVKVAGALPAEDLPPMRARRPGIPSPGLWARKNPDAAHRWEVVRPGIKDLAESLSVPVENLIAPKPLRTLLWDPVGTDPESLDAQLADLDVRPWQRDAVVPVISQLLSGD